MIDSTGADGLPPTPKGATLSIVVFAVLWTSLVGVFDLFTVIPTARQMLVSSSLQPVDAEVIKSPGGSEENGTAAPWIEYRYTVGGRAYESRRVSLSPMDDANARLPVALPGDTIQVFYNPSDPSEAVLRRGVSETALFIMLFLTPFHAIGIGMLIVGVRGLWYAKFPGANGGAGISRRGDVIRFPAQRRSAFLWAVIGAGLPAVLMIFPGAFFFQFAPPLWYTGGAFTVCAVVGMLSWFSAVIKNASLTGDVVIDRAIGVVTLPARKNRRKAVVERSLADLRRIELHGFDDESDTQINDRKVVEFSPVLIFADGENEAQERLVRWIVPARAGSLGTWLAGELGVPMTGWTRVAQGLLEGEEDEEIVDSTKAEKPTAAAITDRPTFEDWYEANVARLKDLRGEKSSAIAGIGCMGVFATLWIGFVCFFLVMMSRGVMTQVESAGFPTAPGVVTSAEVEATSDGEGGTNYNAAIEFSYEIEGQAYSGDRVRAGMTWSSSSSAAETVARYPVGTPVSVFYDPDDPSRALLEPGLKGTDLFGFMFMTPFIAVGIGTALAVLSMLKEIMAPSPTGGVPVRRLGMRLVARTAWFSPVIAALTAGGAAGFVLIFVLGFAAGSGLPMWLALAGIAVVIAAALVAAVLTAQAAQSGRGSLVIDRAAGTVTLPAKGGKLAHAFKQAEGTIPIDAVRDIEIERRKTRSKGKNSGTTTVYRIWLVLDESARDKRRRQILETGGARKATRFATWLAAVLFEGGPDEGSVLSLAEPAHGSKLT